MRAYTPGREWCPMPAGCLSVPVPCAVLCVSRVVRESMVSAAFPWLFCPTRRGSALSALAVAAGATEQQAQAQRQDRTGQDRGRNGTRMQAHTAGIGK
jgi:hypothetical protein